MIKELQEQDLEVAELRREFDSAVSIVPVFPHLALAFCNGKAWPASQQGSKNLLPSGGSGAGKSGGAGVSLMNQSKKPVPETFRWLPRSQCRDAGESVETLSSG